MPENKTVGDDEQPLRPIAPTLNQAFGVTGTEKYSGYITEEPNQLWRDERRVEIVEEMRRGDGAVKAILNAIKAPILSTEAYMDYNKDDELESEFAEKCQMELFNMPYRSWKELLREMLTYFDFGHWVGELVWMMEDGEIKLLDVAPRIQHSIEKWETLDGMDGVTQRKRSDEASKKNNKNFVFSIPRDKLIVLTNDKEGDDVTGQSVLRSAYIHYKMKNTAYRVSAIAIERMGVGIPTGTLPEGATPDEKQKFEEALKNIRANQQAYMLLPNEKYKFEFKTVQGNAMGSTVKDNVDHHNRMILLSVLAQFMDLGSGDSGSFALSKDQSGFFLQHIQDKASYIADQLYKDVILRMAWYNPKYQKLIDENRVPRLKFADLGTVDFAEISTVIKTLVDAGLIQADDIDIQIWLRKTMKLPELSEEAIEEMQLKKEEEKVEVKEVPETPVIPKEDDEIPEEKEVLHSFAEKKKFVLWRELTLQEKRCDFIYLNESFNNIEQELEDELVQIANDDLTRTVKELENKLKTGDVYSILAIAFISKNKLSAAIKNYLKKSFEVGKKAATEEVNGSGAERPPTTTKDVQLMNFEAEQIAEDLTNRLNQEAKNRTREGLAKGVAAGAITVAVSNALKSSVSNGIGNIVSTVVAENVNKGRRFVFERNLTKIQAFLRSEILDEKTCNMCMSLDGRFVMADDPMAKMDIVHSGCRGIWIPIMVDEKIEGSIGIPKTVSDSFDTVGGVPTVNNFKQLKKPINKANAAVKQELKRREEK